MNAKLLIIAEPRAANVISRRAQSDSWATHIAELGNDCLNAVLGLKPEFIILDTRSGCETFAEFCRCIRSIDGMSTVPLIVLVGPEGRYLNLLEAGADDCWPEPNETREFEIRLTALHRRLNPPRESRVIRCWGVELDLDRFTVRSSGLPAQLTGRQLTVLKYLMENSGKYISDEELLEHAWCNTTLDCGAVKTCVRRLRKILSATGAFDVIRTVKGGYVFDTGIAPMSVPWGPPSRRPNDRIEMRLVAESISKN